VLKPVLFCHDGSGLARRICSSRRRSSASALGTFRPLPLLTEAESPLPVRHDGHEPAKRRRPEAGSLNSRAARPCPPTPYGPWAEVEVGVGRRGERDEREQRGSCY
jgi:hypothetical protein